MTTKLVSPWAAGAYGKVLDAWSAQLLAPPFVFLLGATLLYGHLDGWDLRRGFEDLVELGETRILVIVVLGIVVGAAVAQVLNRLGRSALRLASGYWPAWAAPLTARAVARKLAEAKSKGEEHERLWALPHRTPEEDEKARRLDAWLDRMPPLPKTMPTRLGNVLRAAEERPREWYGLDAAVCWPRLWPHVSETLRADLKESYAGLVLTLQAAFWSLLFALLPLAFLGHASSQPQKYAFVLAVALAIGLGGSLVAWRLAQRAAEIYADGFATAFDLHRLDLYKALRWPPPASPEEERTGTGPQVSAFLWRADAPEGFLYHVEAAADPSKKTGT